MELFLLALILVAVSISGISFDARVKQVLYIILAVIGALIALAYLFPTFIKGI
jgi:hypothetical protein